MRFRKQNLMVFQIQLAKRQAVVPLTRDYIGREEARLRALEEKSRPPWPLAGEGQVPSGGVARRSETASEAPPPL